MLLYKKHTMTYFLIFLGFSICVVSTSNLTQNVSSSGYSYVFNVGVYENAPKVFSDSSGKFIGIFPEIMDYIARQVNWKINYINGTWLEGLDRLQTGIIDIMVDVAYSYEREQIYVFNFQSLFTNWGVIYQREDSQLIYTYDNLAGKDIAVMNGSIHYNDTNGIKDLLERFNIPCNFIELDDYDEVFENVANEIADYGVVNRLFGLLHEKEYHLKQSPLMFNPVELKFAFTKGSENNSYLISTIDYYLKILKDNRNSIYYQVLNKYIYNISNAIPSWVIILIGSLAGVAILSIGLNYGLKRVVDRRSNELYEAKNQLMHQQYQTEKYEALRILSSGIAHDFNNFLTIIFGNIEYLKNDNSLSKDAKESLDDIFLALDSARGLVRQLKMFSNKSEVSMAQEDIIPCIQDVAKLVLSRTNCSLKFESEFPTLVLNLDKGQIVQALTNLLLNAVQAMPNGGTITIKIKSNPTNNKIPHIKEQNINDFIQISIQDEGKGIPPEYISNIFTPYFTTKEKGTGLGLAVTKSIIERHGGTITFASEMNKGTTFFIYLPKKTHSNDKM